MSKSLKITQIGETVQIEIDGKVIHNVVSYELRKRSVASLTELHLTLYVLNESSVDVKIDNLIVDEKYAPQLKGVD